MTPRYAVASTGRSGSGYIAAVLSAAGLRCGHEQWWNPHEAHNYALMGDSSWMILPELERYVGLVLHQVRNPLHVVASFAASPEHEPYRGLRHECLGRLRWAGDPLREAMQIVLEWNSLIEERVPAAGRWRVEDVNPELVQWVGECLGVLVGYDSAEAACASVEATHNEHNGGVLVLSWDELPQSHLTDSLYAMARRYGYE